MQKIFTAAIGRTGTMSLAQAITRYGRRCVAEHEPPALLLQQLAERPFFLRHPWLRPGGRALTLGRDLQRRYLYSDELLGRGAALEWYYRGDQRLALVAARRLRRIERFARRGYRHYVESSQFFLRTFCYEMHSLVPDLGVIKLVRDPVETARSLANRNKSLDLNSLPAHHPGNLFRIPESQILTAFEFYAHLWLETELRWHAFRERTGLTRVVVLQTSDISDPAKLGAMFAFFGIAHDPIEGLMPANTNVGRKLPPTRPTSEDVAAFHRVLAWMPDAQRDRIEYLRGYVAGAA
ncbi:MAG: hypothetical protein FJX56_02240 [Alphaproteobacteria bacterium]|nr:hypothetical protein [Alphaproteobacteria bacterium]